MVEKPISGDAEQRRAQTRAARFQSGLPPEEGDDGSPGEEPQTTPDGDAEEKDVA
jgi:hypothetical protein